MKNKKNDAPVVETLMPEVKVEEKSTEGTATEVVKPKKRNYKKRTKKVQPVVDPEPQADICICDCDPECQGKKKTNWFVKTWNKFTMWLKFTLWFK
jgi:hypothetical protein